MLPSAYDFKSPLLGIGIGLTLIFLPSSANFCLSFAAFSISASTYRSWSVGPASAISNFFFITIPGFEKVGFALNFNCGLDRPTDGGLPPGRTSGLL